MKDMFKSVYRSSYIKQMQRIFHSKSLLRCVLKTKDFVSPSKVSANTVKSVYLHPEIRQARLTFAITCIRLETLTEMFHPTCIMRVIMQSGL
jgi:hypothetical protein